MVGFVGTGGVRRGHVTARDRGVSATALCVLPVGASHDPCLANVGHGAREVATRQSKHVLRHHDAERLRDLMASCS